MTLRACALSLSLSRLVLYIEREVRSVTRVKKNLKYSAYLSQCLNSLVVHLSNTASLILGAHIHTPSVTVFLFCPI